MMQDNVIVNNNGDSIKEKWLSFVVPVYNGEKYLRDCLDSLINQNAIKEEYEIICVNDGSKDGSKNILDEYSSNYSNVKVIHKENAGVSVARNVGMDAASGKYIWFIDCDDFICKDCLKKVIDTLKHNNPKIVRLAHKEVEEDCDWNQTKLDKFSINLNSTKCRTLAVWKIIISKNFLEERGIKFVGGITRGEDGLFCDEIYIKLEQEYIIEIESVLYFYRQNSSSVCHQMSVESANRVIFDYIKRMDIYKSKLELLCNNEEKKRRIRETRGVMLGSLLSKLPYTSLERKEIFKILKDKKLFNVSFIKPGDKLGWYLTKKNAITYFLLKIPIIYFVYFNIKRKNFKKKG